MPEKMTAVQVIRRYFFRPDEKPADIIKEIKALTPDDKRELAEGAAHELGIELTQAAS